MTPLSTQGLGPKSRQWLEAIGITTIEQIEELGVVEVYIRLKEAFPHRVTLNMLWGLQAALMGIHWNQLPEDIKEDLRQQLKAAGL